MDKVLIEKFTGRYIDEVLKLNSYSIKKIGLRKRNNYLRIGGNFLYCVPSELSFKMSKALLVLSRKEIEFFQSCFSQKQKLYLEFYSNLFPRKISVFLWVKIDNIQVLNRDTNVCIFDFRHVSVPNDYKEILIQVFREQESFETLYENEENRNLVISSAMLRSSGIEDHALVRIDGDFDRLNCKIMEMTLDKIKILMEIDEEALKNNAGPVYLEIFSDDISTFLNGKIENYQELSEVGGFFIVDLSYKYTPCLVDSLSSLFDSRETR